MGFFFPNLLVLYALCGGLIIVPNKVLVVDMTFYVWVCGIMPKLLCAAQLNPRVAVIYPAYCPKLSPVAGWTCKEKRLPS